MYSAAYMRILLFAAMLVSCKQEKNQPAQRQASSGNSITDKHISIPGSKMYIIPPAGFAWSDVLGGFVKDKDGSTIRWIDGLSIMYEAIKKSEIEKITKEEIVTVDSYPGKIINYTTTMNMIGCDIIFGDSSFTEILRGNCFANQPQSLKDIEASFKTIIYKK